MWLSREQLRSLGLAGLGSDVQVDERAVLLGAPSIRLGSHVRVDAFTVLSAGPGQLEIGDHVHVSAAVLVYAAGAGVTVGDFVSLSPRVSVFSATDDFSGGSLTNPTVPDDLRGVRAEPVVVGRHVVVGTGSVVLPGVTIGDGASVGALTLVRRSVPGGAVVAGNPMRRIGSRDTTRLHALETELLRRERDR